MEDDINELFVCECHDICHQIVVTYFDDDNDDNVYVSIHLNKLGFWKRLWHGIKYIFGYKCVFGDFEEFIINSEDADKLQEIVDILKKKEG